MYGVLVDVSGSMECAYALDRSHHANVERTHAIITTLVNIVKREVAHHERNDEIFVSAFGLQARSAETCDLIALLDNIEETDDGYSIKGVQKDHDVAPSSISYSGIQKLVELAHESNVSHIVPWIHKCLSEREAEFLHRVVSRDRNLLNQLVKKLPWSATTTASNVASFALDFVGLGEMYDDRVASRAHNSKAYSFAKQIVEKEEEREAMKRWEEETRKKMQEELIFSIIEGIQCPQPRSVQQVSEMLASLLHEDDASGGASVDDCIHDKIEKMIEPIKPYILGGTPMHRAFADAEAAFKQSTVTPKVLFVLSDGQYAGADPREIARRLRDAGVTIVTCFLTNNHIANPKCLLDPSTPLQDFGCQVLFDMSSTMKNIETPVSYLTDADWELPGSGESRLFLQANSLDVVNEFCKILVAQLTSPCDALVNLLDKVRLADHIIDTNADFEPDDQEKLKTCYAHAIAAVFHLAMHRIVGREGGIPDVVTIRDHLIEEHGVKGANTEKVLKKVCPEYRLHYREVDERGARQAINQRRPCVVRFRLNKEQWAKYREFFRLSSKGILKKTDVIDTTHTKPTGHAVVLIRCDPDCLIFMNSRGTKQFDKGFFRIKDQDVVHDMQFYDIYWNEEDLFPSEKEAYKKKCIEKAKQLADTYPSVQDLLHECPSCKRNSRVSEFLGHILEAECPHCHHKFTPTNEAFLKSLYTRQFE